MCLRSHNSLHTDLRQKQAGSNASWRDQFLSKTSPCIAQVDVFFCQILLPWDPPHHTPSPLTFLGFWGIVSLVLLTTRRSTIQGGFCMKIIYRGILIIITFAAVAFAAGLAFVLIEYWKDLAHRYSLDAYFVRAAVNISMASLIFVATLRLVTKKLVAEWKYKPETLDISPSESSQRKDAIV